MEEILVKYGLKSAHLITGLIGGAVSLFFGKRKAVTMRDKLKSVMFVIVGAVVTGYSTPIILKANPSWSDNEHGIAFVIGLFGMGIVEGAFTVVNEYKKHPLDIIKKIRDSFAK